MRRGCSEAYIVRLEALGPVDSAHMNHANLVGACLKKGVDEGGEVGCRLWQSEVGSRHGCREELDDLQQSDMQVEFDVVSAGGVGDGVRDELRADLGDVVSRDEQVIKEGLDELPGVSHAVHFDR